MENLHECSGRRRNEWESVIDVPHSRPWNVQAASIGYYPNHPVKDGKWHSVRIRMKNPDYFARTRKEYLDK